jgi:hypothetical protein
VYATTMVKTVRRRLRRGGGGDSCAHRNSPVTGRERFVKWQSPAIDLQERLPPLSACDPSFPLARGRIRLRGFRSDKQPGTRSSSSSASWSRSKGGPATTAMLHAEAVCLVHRPEPTRCQPRAVRMPRSSGGWQLEIPDRSPGDCHLAHRPPGCRKPRMTAQPPPPPADTTSQR